MRKCTSLCTRGSQCPNFSNMLSMRSISEELAVVSPRAQVLLGRPDMDFWRITALATMREARCPADRQPGLPFRGYRMSGYASRPCHIRSLRERSQVFGPPESRTQEAEADQPEAHAVSALTPCRGHSPPSADASSPPARTSPTSTPACTPSPTPARTPLALFR